MTSTQPPVNVPAGSGPAVPAAAEAHAPVATADRPEPAAPN